MSTYLRSDAERVRSNMQRRELGDIGEAMASSFLIEKGMEMIGRQVKIGRGEIDLVVQDDGELVIVEVKTRQSNAFGNPEDSITQKKLRQLRSLGERYCKKSGWKGSWRIDIVAISLSNKAQPIHYIKGVA
jgi:putative endonuclease